MKLKEYGVVTHHRNWLKMSEVCMLYQRKFYEQMSFSDLKNIMYITANIKFDQVLLVYKYIT